MWASEAARPEDLHAKLLLHGATEAILHLRPFIGGWRYALIVGLRLDTQPGEIGARRGNDMGKFRAEISQIVDRYRLLDPGDVCRVEIFSVIGGYQAGVCRTAVVERAPPMAEEIWKLLVEAKYQIMAMVKPGASCLEIYRAFIAKLAEKNLPPIAFVGHGIGLHLHEDPYLGKTPILGRPGEDAVLEEGMVLGFEPLCYQTGFGFGMQNKDILVVTASGSKLLSDTTDTDELLVIA